MARATLSTVVVAHNSLAQLRRSLPALLQQLSADDELIVVDNASGDDLRLELERLAPRARLISLVENIGFAAGANRGVAAARGDLIVLLNPDASVDPGWAEAICAPWGGPWAAWMGLVLLEAGTEINTSGGVLHFTGFGWAGQVGQPVVAAPRVAAGVAFLSGACLAIPRSTFERAGGFAEHFFMYCEDVDLSLKLRLAGGTLAIVPDARVRHAYEFAKGDLKWRLLERNRWATVIRTYPSPLLAAVLPAMLVTELAVWVVALRGGWGRMKALATLDLLRSLPRLIRERGQIQSTRRIPAATFAASLSARLDSPYFGSVGKRPMINRALCLYWSAVRALLH
jgi:GT2 family glycosyltransferase